MGKAEAELVEDRAACFRAKNWARPLKMGSATAEPSR